MNRRGKIAIGIGFIVLLVTIGIGYFGIKNWEGVMPAGYAFIIWAEVVLFGGLAWLEKIADKTEQVMVRASFSTGLALYAFSAFVVSFVFMLIFPRSITIFWILQLLLLAIAAVFLILSFGASKSVGESHAKTMSAVKQMENMMGRINRLSVSSGAEEYKDSLQKIASDLRFADISSVVPVDTEIEQVVSNLELEFAKAKEKQSGENVEQALVRLNSLVAQRKLTITEMKKGRL